MFGSNILSLTYRNKIDTAIKNLENIGFKYFVMYVIFNDTGKLVLSNMYHMLDPYYGEGLYKQDYSFRSDVVGDKDHYLCDRTVSVSPEFNDLLNKRFNIYRSYYISRKSPECTFIFGAIKDVNHEKLDQLYSSTIKDFEKTCFYFVSEMSSLITDHNKSFKRSFTFTNKKFLESIITQNYVWSDRALTDREVDCLWLSAKGKTTKQIGKELHISPLTVETHNKNIREKFCCSTMIEAVIEGVQRGIIGKINPFSPR